MKQALILTTISQSKMIQINGSLYDKRRKILTFSNKSINAKDVLKSQKTYNNGFSGSKIRTKSKSPSKLDMTGFRMQDKNISSKLGMYIKPKKIISPEKKLPQSLSNNNVSGTAKPIRNLEEDNFFNLNQKKSNRSIMELKSDMKPNSRRPPLNSSLSKITQKKNLQKLEEKVGFLRNLKLEQLDPVSMI